MNAKGFTLIEVIISIVMASIAAAMLINFLGTGVMQSSDPLLVLDDNYSALRGIEIVNADYREKLELDPSQPINIYVGSDLSSTVTELGSIGVAGKFVDFSDPDANRQVSEIISNNSIYVKITATRNNSKMVTLLGN